MHSGIFKFDSIFGIIDKSAMKKRTLSFIMIVFFYFIISRSILILAVKLWFKWNLGIMQSRIFILNMPVASKML